MVVPPAPRRQLSRHPNEPGRHPSPSDVPKLAVWLVYQGYTKGTSNFGDDDRIIEAKEFLILTEMEGNVKVWGLGEWKSNDPYPKSLLGRKVYQKRVLHD